MRRLKFIQTVIRAHAARDGARFGEAARLYREALAVEPRRNGVRVQMANMLKDSGQHAEAERAYLDALQSAPREADIHLQLARLRLATGRRALALEGFRRAIDLDPNSPDAVRELAAAGDVSAMAPKGGAGEGVLKFEELYFIRARLEALGDELSKIRRHLPETLASAAFPVGGYREMRALFDVPPPVELEPGGSRPTVAVFIDAGLARDLGALHRQITSVVSQSYANWRLAIAGHGSEQRALVERFASGDPRVCWVDPADGDPEPERRMASEVGADWILLTEPNTTFHPQMLAWIAAVAGRLPCQAVVFDAEREGAGGTLELQARRMFDRHSLREANVWGNTFAIEADQFSRLEGASEVGTLSERRRRLLEALPSEAIVAHIPLPLSRCWQIEEDRHAGAPSEFAPASPVGHSDVPICVLIPTRDNLGDVSAFVESLIQLARRPDRLSVLLANNGDGAYGALLRERFAGLSSVRIEDAPGPFNWSGLCNRMATGTDAPLLVFANDDMRMLSADWDELVRGLLAEPEVGAVGARLLYEDHTVQHAGILFDWNGSTIHDGLHQPADAEGPAARWSTTHEVSAVTGAFLATRRSAFEAVGGFDAGRLAISYSDVDFALRLRARGMRIVWSPRITAIHHESKTRGLDHLDAAKAARDAEERRTLLTIWPGALDFEPTLNPFWRQTILPHRLLYWPSTERVWEYLQATTKANPWLVAQGSQSVQ
ncbi:MAG TPA: glycosyltransferase [Caulobacteraceae bacterium]